MGSKSDFPGNMGGGNASGQASALNGPPQPQQQGAWTRHHQILREERRGAQGGVQPALGGLRSASAGALGQEGLFFERVWSADAIDGPPARLGAAKWGAPGGPFPGPGAANGAMAAPYRGFTLGIDHLALGGGADAPPPARENLKLEEARKAADMIKWGSAANGGRHAMATAVDSVLGSPPSPVMNLPAQPTETAAPHQRQVGRSRSEILSPSYPRASSPLQGISNTASFPELPSPKQSERAAPPTNATETLAGRGGSVRVSASPQLSVHSLYKTELCRSWEETGSCRYGSKCQFAHGKSELRPIARHPKYKTEICRTFATNGTCPYGTRCRFIHYVSAKDPFTKQAKDVCQSIPQASLDKAAAASNNNNGVGATRGAISVGSAGARSAPRTESAPRGSGLAGAGQAPSAGGGVAQPLDTWSELLEEGKKTFAGAASAGARLHQQQQQHVKRTRSAYPRLEQMEQTSLPVQKTRSQRLPIFQSLSFTEKGKNGSD